MIVGFTAVVLIAYNGIIDRPAPDEGLEFGISLEYGYWLALLAAIAIAVIGFSARWRAGRGRRARHPARSEARLAAMRQCHLAGRALGLQARPQPRARAGPGDRGRGARRRALGRPRREGVGRPGAAVDAMRLLLDTVPMDGIVVIGEGEKDEAPMLYNGERIGDGSPPEVDIAVDPLEGTTLTARGMPSALAVIALSERGTMFDPGPVRLHGEDRRRPRDRRPAQPRRAARRGDRQGRRAQGHGRRRRHRDHARPPPPRGEGGGDPRGRRPDPVHHRRRRLRGAVRGLRPTAGSTCCGASAARRRA